MNSPVHSRKVSSQAAAILDGLTCVRARQRLVQKTVPVACPGRPEGRLINRPLNLRITGALQAANRGHESYSVPNRRDYVNHCYRHELSGSEAYRPCNPPGSHHINQMAIYQIIPSGDSEFHIGIAGSDGARQTMLGFASKEDAEAWIAQDKRLNDAAEAHSSDIDTQKR